MNCERCKKTPGFHSFEYLGQAAGNQLFYCFPANNTESVRTRDDMLQFVSHFPRRIPWSLFFHARGYTLSHLMPLSIALEMANILQRDHSETLQKIYIMEGNWFMRFLFVCIFPFLSQTMREKFVLLNGSFLEMSVRLQEDGIPFAQLQALREYFRKIE